MAVQVAAPSSVGFSGKSKYRYDVFLSFRGEDTRHSFTVHLYNALRRKGINAFIDDKKLGKGEEISPTLLKAIERSRISIIVFSENYANSTWCLEELAHIIWCLKQKNQLVMPIFYMVDPEDVQYQRNSFEKAMTDLEDRFRDDLGKVQKWRSALSEAASLSSAWLLEDGYEGGFIESIVEDAYARLPPKRFHIVEYIVGLEPRIEEVMSLLEETRKSVCMLGIHGIGGIGKTTLAKAIYNSIFYHFEGACFLFDVKDASKKYQGVVRLQQKLLSEILEEKIMMFGSVDEGISRIKHRLSHKKVLLVLDDVDEVEQLEQLAGGCDWFGYGSKVIITTRNRQLLIARNVKKTYEMMKLNEHDSLKLFYWHAFPMSQPPKKYQDMSSCAISYAQGLPLALRVIGSNLKDKNFEEWKSILEQYERIQDRTIYKVLKISYDCLQDGAKRIFLDIACFFNEEMLESIKEIVEACDSGARFYLEVLFDKSLITFVDNKRLSIHDLIRQMGREIVKQEAPLSRLWDYKDVLKVLNENLGSNNIEGIMLDPPQQEKIKWSGTAFEKMNKLRILVVRNVQFSMGPAYLPNSLRWLEWQGYPSPTLPTDFSPLQLILLKLPRSSLILKESFKSFTNYLTEMDFSYCDCITEVPDMSQLQSLKTLDLNSSSNLIKVHESVGSLPKLVRLNVSGCTKLSSFPREIKMPSLELFHLSKCWRLDNFPHVVGNMDALMSISMGETAIKQLPPSIGNLSRLQSLSMHHCRSLKELPTSLFKLGNLETINFSGSHPRARKSLIEFMQELHLILICFPNLQGLDLSLNDFVSLPKCIKECSQLRELDVRDCKNLRDIPELPSNLHHIYANNCTSLTEESLDSLYSQAKKELSELEINVPTNTTFPDWLDYCCEGGTLSFRARGNLPHTFFAFEFGKPCTCSYHPLGISVSVNGRKIIINRLNLDYRSILVEEGHVLLVDIFTKLTIEMKELNTFKGLDWNDVEIQATSTLTENFIERCGIYVYKQQTDMKDVKFKSPLLSRASLKRRAMGSPPNEPPNKSMRTDEGKLTNTTKGSRRSKPRQTFHSCYRRRMVFPMRKRVWKFLYH